jgi:Apea-like HEPN
MTNVFPAVDALAADIAQFQDTAGRNASDLISQAGQLRTGLDRFDNSEDLGVAAYEEPGSTVEELADLITAARTQIGRELWARELFVGVSVLDELLFQVLKAASPDDPLSELLERLRDSPLDKDGFVLFPIHSFGILEAGALHALSDSRAIFSRPEWGLVLTPQTNDMAETVRFLDEVRVQLSINEALPTELIAHWRRSRPTAWLEKNPLLAVRLRHISGHYYDPEFFLTRTLQAASGLLAMLSTLQSGSASSEAKSLSSRSINNFQTLDIHHYLVFSASGNQELDGDCVPVNETRPSLVEISELNFDLDPQFWSNQPAEADRLQAATWDVYRGYLRYGMWDDGSDARSRVFRKMFDSLTFFKRSFSAHEWQGTVGLGTAFEMLITDKFERGVTKRLEKNTRKLLRGRPEQRTYPATVKKLYNARSEIVHAGRRSTEVDLPEARRAYVLCFQELVDRLPSLNVNSRSAIQDLVA